ncbi:hypothetical protein LJB42_004704 [Komagataella kurtzmanii]|nr:hypothetical protein LJB42_004704 [Komagataella kurtzmanii]
MKFAISTLFIILQAAAVFAAFPISDITVVSERTDASTAYLSDWFVVSFVFSTAGSDETIAGDATIEVSIPNELEFVQYPDSVDPSVSEFFTTAGVQVLSTAFDYDSHVLTFTFSDPGQVITDLEGVVFFTLKLSEQFTESASPGQHTFDFETSDQTYSPSVDLVVLDRSQPIKLSNAVTGGVEWFVDIPGAFGDITNIDISTVQTPGTFDCSEVKYAVGSSLNEFGDFTPQDRTTFFSNSSSGEWIPITPASGLPVESFECGDGTISLSFAGELADDEVLRVSFLSNLADDVLEVQNVVNVDLTTADSRKRALTSFVLDEPFYRASRTDTAAFEAFAAVPADGDITSTSTAITSVTATVTQTTVTSVCYVCAETPVTVTYTAPVITNPIYYTTKVHVCNVCAETPITYTVTIPCETDEYAPPKPTGTEGEKIVTVITKEGGDKYTKTYEEVTYTKTYPKGGHEDHIFTVKTNEGGEKVTKTYEEVTYTKGPEIVTVVTKEGGEKVTTTYHDVPEVVTVITKEGGEKVTTTYPATYTEGHSAGVPTSASTPPQATYTVSEAHVNLGSKSAVGLLAIVPMLFLAI